MNIQVGSLYKHSKKGGIYKVIAIAKHSVTLEDMVVYQEEHDNLVSKVWVRPLSMFEEEVEINREKVKRFEKIS